MHIPDGFIDAPTSAAAGAIAAAAVGVSLKRMTPEVSDNQIPLVGLTGAYIFAVQMINFPVAAGTSGHLLGGVLAAVLVGPTGGVVAVTIVLAVQALLFADGGLTALGLNTVNMAVGGALGGYMIFRALRAVLPRGRRGLVAAAGIAAFCAPLLAALLFTLEFAIGGNGAAPTHVVFAAMVGVHALIGIGEGVITAFTISAILATRPDLVHGASDLSQVSAQMATP